MDYDLDEQRIIKEIKEKGHKRGLLQLADGLKPQARDLVKTIESETDAECLIWFGSCFGACDLPLSIKSLGVSLVVAFGHNTYIKDVKGW